MEMELGIVSGRIYVKCGSDGCTLAQLSKRQLLDMKNIGATSLRIEFEDQLYGIGLSRRTDVDLVKAYKEILQNAAAREVNMKVIGVLNWNSMPPNYADNTPRVDPSGLNFTDFDQKFIPQIVQTFNLHEQTYPVNEFPALEGWEIWNEPDVGSNHFWRGGGFNMTEEVAWMNVKIMEAKQNLRSTRKIIFTAISHADEEKLVTMLSGNVIKEYKRTHNGQLPCDYYGVHGYGNQPDPESNGYAWGNGTFLTEIQNFLNKTQSLIPANLGIYLTEIGFSSGPPKPEDPPHGGLGSEEKQAKAMKFAIQGLRDRFANRIVKAFWYVYRDDEQPPGVEGYGKHGLRRIPRDVAGAPGGGEIKLVWNMARNLVRRAGVGQANFEVQHQYQSKFIEAFNRWDTADNKAGYPDLPPSGYEGIISSAIYNSAGNQFVFKWGQAFVQFFNGGMFPCGGVLGQEARSIICYVAGEAQAGVIAAGMFAYWWEKGGVTGVGYPFNNGGGWDFHIWEAYEFQAKVQDFKLADGRPSMIMRELRPNNSPSLFHISGDIYTQYMDGGGIAGYGTARSEAVKNSSGKYVQQFAKATLTER